MSSRLRIFGPLLALAVAGAAGGAASQPKPGAWQDTFDEKESDLVSTGTNPYFSLQPGTVLELEGKENGKPMRLVVSVLPETRKVGAVETRVVEERETLDGNLVEISRNFFAYSKRTHSVYYFGEDVDVYRGGKVVNHEGAWLAGKNGARYGMMMPGEPRIHARYYQEIAPKVAMDRAEIVSVSDRLETPAGKYENVLKMEETTLLEPGVKEYKYFAAGVGLLKDGGAVLVRRRAPAAGN